MMEISSNAPWPFGELSNFTANPFVIDRVRCGSMEGFLQSLKFANRKIQKYVCSLNGKDAKREGRSQNWQETQLLFWNGKEIDRHSDDYQALLDRAFRMLFDQSESFRLALLATKGQLRHSMGKQDPDTTILTEAEFCSRLMKLRDDFGPALDKEG